MRTRIKPHLDRKYKSLKLKTWLNIIIITLLLSIVETPIVTSGKVQKTLGNQVMVKGATYKAPELPTLNPDEEERDQNIALIKKIWGRDAGIGLEIARCESGYRTKATNFNTNDTVDQGVFQINSVHEIPSMDNPVANISYAYSMYLNQGTNPWNSSKNCWN